MDLSGTWKFQLDPDNAGMNNKWFNNEFNDCMLEAAIGHSADGTISTITDQGASSDQKTKGGSLLGFGIFFIIIIAVCIGGFFMFRKGLIPKTGSKGVDVAIKVGLILLVVGLVAFAVYWFFFRKKDDYEGLLGKKDEMKVIGTVQDAFDKDSIRRKYFPIG